MSGIGQGPPGALFVVLLGKLPILLFQIMVKLHQEAILQMAPQNVLGRGVVLLSSTHSYVVTVLHHPNVLVIMVVEIIMEEVIMGKHLYFLWINIYVKILTILSKSLEFNYFISYEGIQATETNVIGHLIDGTGAHLEAGALQGFLSLLFLTHHTQTLKS